MRTIDLSGKRFGRLVAVRPTDQRVAGKVVWECQCDCGNSVLVKSTHLTGGHTKSCGCLRLESQLDNLSIAHEKIQQSDAKDGTRISMLDAKTFKTNTSGHKGVAKNKVTGKWEAYLHYQRKKIYLGLFETLEEAINARKAAEKKYHEPHKK